MIYIKQLLFYFIRGFHLIVFGVNCAAFGILLVKTLIQEIPWYITIPIITFLSRLLSWDKCPLTKLENKLKQKDKIEN